VFFGLEAEAIDELDDEEVADELEEEKREALIFVIFYQQLL